MFEWSNFIAWCAEIAILTFIFYVVLRVLRGTRGFMIILAICIVLAVLSFVAKVANLIVLSSFFSKLLGFLPIFIVVVFQEEIRRILTAMMVQCGKIRLRLLGWFLPEGVDHIQTTLLLPVIGRLSASRTGCLIAIEQTVELGTVISQGKRLDAPLRSNHLLETIFYNGTPLHDGGVVIRGLEIVAAGCTFPMGTQEEKSDQIPGMRHQAARGLSENYDAVVLVVSEETGRISLAIDGKLEHIPSIEVLRKRLNQCLRPLNGDANKSWTERTAMWIKFLMQSGKEIKNHIVPNGEKKHE